MQRAPLQRHPKAGERRLGTGEKVTKNTQSQDCGLQLGGIKTKTSETAGGEPSRVSISL